MLLSDYLKIRYMFGATLLQDYEIESMYLTNYSKTKKQSEKEGRKLLRALDRLVPLLKLNDEITSIHLQCHDTGLGLRYSILIKNQNTGDIMKFTPYLKTKTNIRYDNGNKKYLYFAYLQTYCDVNKKWENVFGHDNGIKLKELLTFINNLRYKK
jgi:hypothetical protein